ncbi:MAG: hypothetical protein D6726_00490 [Nitrospirae bacterium]|nr:MAG: hypothetical protein D6726_00490 [Nitrospirota bacterium]
MERIYWYFKRVLFPSLRPLKTRGIIIAGMHRSGTSCLTGLLEISGLWAGDVIRQAKHNPKGTRENRRVFTMNDELLERSGGSWDNPPEVVRVRTDDLVKTRLILQDYESARQWVLKDPRFLFTLDAWVVHLIDYQLIGTFRHPEAVAMSLYRRNRIPLEEGRRLWLKYNKKMVSLHRKTSFPLLQFGLDEKEYLEQYRTLCYMLKLPYNHDRIKNFYDDDLVHNRDEYSMPDDPELRSVYQYLLEHRIPIAGGTL